MPVIKRRHAATCSTRCRVARHRARSLPAELTRRDRWVRRSVTKTPLRVDGRGPASSTDSSTWSSYKQARRSPVGVGLGYVLTTQDGIVCIDLDHCISDGVVAGWAQAILEMAGATYVEVSLSGTGLHIWGRGKVSTGRVIRDGERAIEVYGTGRYIAMGQRHGNTPARLADLSGVISAL